MRPFCVHFFILLSLIYERLVQFRLFLYRKRIFRERALGCLVISIGNLTVGGTGKTPIVEKFARALQKGGRRVAILSRGYKSVPRTDQTEFARSTLRGVAPDPPRVVSDGKSLLLDSLTAGDEPYMLAHNLKDVIVLVDKDRVKSGLIRNRQNESRHPCCSTTVCNISISNIGSISSWSIGRRRLETNFCFRAEPCASRRVIFAAPVTSSSPKARASRTTQLIERIRRYNRTAEIIECAHQPLYLQDVYTGEQLPLERLRDTFIGSFCGIAAPESFEDGLRKLGAKIELAKRFIDHHRYTEAELQSFINRCIRRDLDMIVTTEKDAVRFPAPGKDRSADLFSCGWKS